MQRARRLALAALLLAGAGLAPALAAGDPPAFYLGITVEHVQDGLLIDEIQPDSAADRAGLAVGDLITDMGGRKAKALTPEEIEAAVSATYHIPVSVTVRRAGSPKAEIRVGP